MAAIARTLKQIGLYDVVRPSILSGILSAWVARADARRELGELSDRMILDIGLDPEEVKAEVGKPFWRT
jgi:uncharacterized protein YjiS (DUF1127 family)